MCFCVVPLMVFSILRLFNSDGFKVLSVSVSRCGFFPPFVVCLCLWTNLTEDFLYACAFSFVRCYAQYSCHDSVILVCRLNGSSIIFFLSFTTFRCRYFFRLYFLLISFTMLVVVNSVILVCRLHNCFFIFLLFLFFSFSIAFTFVILFFFLFLYRFYNRCWWSKSIRARTVVR